MMTYTSQTDYEIDDVYKVVGVRLYGNVINEKYTQVLKENKSLSLQECIALDGFIAPIDDIADLFDTMFSHR